MDGPINLMVKPGNIHVATQISRQSINGTVRMGGATCTRRRSIRMSSASRPEPQCFLEGQCAPINKQLGTSSSSRMQTKIRDRPTTMKRCGVEKFEHPEHPEYPEYPQYPTYPPIPPNTPNTPAHLQWEFEGVAMNISTNGLQLPSTS